MRKVLDRMPRWKLEALARIAKIRGRAFFADPRVMMELREALNVQTK